MLLSAFQQVGELGLGIAGDEHHRRPAQIDPRAASTGPVPACRHHHVGDHQVDGPGMLLRQVQGLLAAGRLDHLVAAGPQQLGRDAAHGVLVLDEQDAPGAGEVRGPADGRASPGWGPALRRPRAHAPAGRYGRLRPRPAWRPPRSSRRLLDDAVDGGQAQARALPHRLGGEEGVEDLVHHVGRDAGPVVPTPRSAPGRPRRGIVQGLGLGGGHRAVRIFTVEPPWLRIRVAGVDRQVHHRGLQLPRSARTCGQVAAVFVTRVTSSCSTGEQHLELADQFAEIEDLALHGLLARKASQLAHQIRRRVEVWRISFTLLGRSPTGWRWPALQLHEDGGQEVLKSCATPPASWPMAGIFWLWAAELDLLLLGDVHQIGHPSGRWISPDRDGRSWPGRGPAAPPGARRRRADPIGQPRGRVGPGGRPRSGRRTPSPRPRSPEWAARVGLASTMVAVKRSSPSRGRRRTVRRRRRRPAPWAAAGRRPPPGPALPERRTAGPGARPAEPARRNQIAAWADGGDVASCFEPLTRDRGVAGLARRAAVSAAKQGGGRGPGLRQARAAPSTSRQGRLQAWMRPSAAARSRGFGQRLDQLVGPGSPSTGASVAPRRRTAPGTHPVRPISSNRPASVEGPGVHPPARRRSPPPSGNTPPRARVSGSNRRLRCSRGSASGLPGGS